MLEKCPCFSTSSVEPNGNPATPFRVALKKEYGEGGPKNHPSCSGPKDPTFKAFFPSVSAPIRLARAISFSRWDWSLPMVNLGGRARDDPSGCAFTIQIRKAVAAQMQHKSPHQESVFLKRQVGLWSLWSRWLLGLLSTVVGSKKRRPMAKGKPRLGYLETSALSRHLKDLERDQIIQGSDQNVWPSRRQGQPFGSKGCFLLAVPAFQPVLSSHIGSHLNTYC